MKKIIFIFAIFSLLASLCLADSDDWHIIKSTHFIVHYRNAPGDFIEELVEKAEDYYNEIADEMGFRRYNFWLWDNRAKIYIYDDAQSYQAATGQPPWSSGCARVKDKIIHTFPYAKGFFDMILPHEIGHIIFREFIGFDNPASPIWLDEGVACYQEKLLRQSIVNGLIKGAMDKRRFINLEWLSQFNPQTIDDKELVQLFYAEAVSIVYYLLKEFGKYRFVLFCQALRDKRNLEEAIASSYHFRNIQELDRAWQRYLKE